MPLIITHVIKTLAMFCLVLIAISCGQKQSSHHQKKDSTILSSDEEITPDIKKVRQEYVLGYKKPKEFVAKSKGTNNEVLRIYGKYYCLLDSAVVIPGKYNYDDTSTAFITHNFAEDIVIISEADTIVKKTITKKDFIDKLDQPLKDYAVIFEPKFEGYDNSTNSFDFQISLSIPVTDLGRSFKFSITKDGRVIVRNNE